MPPLEESDLVLKGQLPQPPDLGGVEAFGEGQPNGLKPDLGNSVALAHVNVGRFASLSTEEVARSFLLP